MKIAFMRVLHAYDVLSDRDQLRFDTHYVGRDGRTVQKVAHLPDNTDSLQDRALAAIEALREALRGDGVSEADCFAPDDTAVRSMEPPMKVAALVRHVVEHAGFKVSGR